MNEPRTIIAHHSWPDESRPVPIVAFEAADELIASLNSAGYVIVPKEPTPYALGIALLLRFKEHVNGDEENKRLYQAMLTASQKEPDQG